jgi:hypothetical protein
MPDARYRRTRTTDATMEAPTHGGAFKDCVVMTECAVHTVTLPEGSFAAIVHSNPGPDGEAYLAVLDRSEVDDLITLLRNAIDDADLIDAGKPPVHMIGGQG